MDSLMGGKVGAFVNDSHMLSDVGVVPWILVEYGDGSFVRAEDAEDHLDGGCLAGSVRSNESCYGAFLNVEAEPIDCDDSTIMLLEAFRRNH